MCIISIKNQRMIKMNVTVCGVVSKAAVCRTNKEGKPFVAMSINLVIPAKSGINKTIEVSVIKDGTLMESGNCRVGDRIEVTGVLTPKKRGETIYFNMVATGINFAPTTEKDGITGEMEFRGKVGKSIDEKKDKNGKTYFLFNAFSAEKVEDGFEYLWVRFLMFDQPRETWLQPGVKVYAKGKMELSAYNDKIDFTCRPTETSLYVPQPSNG